MEHGVRRTYYISSSTLPDVEPGSKYYHGIEMKIKCTNKRSTEYHTEHYER